MGAVFRFPVEHPRELVRFAWSPLFESVLSMRAVVAPKREPLHLPWARRCRDALDEHLLHELTFLASSFDSHVPGVFEVGLTGSSPEFDDELAAFATLDPTLVAYEVSLTVGGLCCGPREERGRHLVADAGYRDEVLALAEGDHRALVASAFDDPVALRDRWADVLRRYWEQAFADEWTRLLPRIEREVTEGARALVTGGMAGLVAELLPEGRWDASGGRVVVERTWNAEVDVAERGGLLFVPTVHGWPCVLLEVAPPWPPAIVSPLRDLRHPEVPTASDREVAEGLRALGDETRLQIARLVAEEARSTRELAQLLSLSDSSVSRHLKTLEAAGVVTARRDGYFVLYRLVEDRIGQLGGALRHTLGLARAASGPVPALPVSLGRSIPRDAARPPSHHASTTGVRA